VDFSIHFTIDINVDEHKFISLKAENISVDHKVNQLDITGVLLYKLLGKVIGWFNGMINKQLLSAISTSLNTGIAAFNDKFQKTIQIPAYDTDVLIHIESQPLHTTTYTEMDFDFDICQHVDIKNFLQIKEEVVSKLGVPEGSEIKIGADQVLITDTISAIFRGIDHSITVSNDSLPADFPIKLDTKSLSAFIPGLDTAYGEVDCIVKLTILSSPTVALKSSDQSITANLELMFEFALQSKPEEIIFGFTSNEKAVVILDPKKEDKQIHFTIKTLTVSNVKITVPFGNTDPDDMAYMLNFAIKTALKAVGQLSIDIPTIIQGLSFDSVNVQIQDTLLDISLLPNFQDSKFVK
jgi:hypothetical protein